MVRTGTRIRSGWLRTDALGSQRWCHCSRPTLMLITCLSTSSAAVHSCHIGWNAAQHFSRHCCLQGRQSAGRARHALAQTPRHTLRCARALLRECTRASYKAARKYTAPPHRLVPQHFWYKIDGRHLLESVATSWAECAGSHQAKIYVFRAAASVRPLRALSAVVVCPSHRESGIAAVVRTSDLVKFRGVLKEGAG